MKPSLTLTILAIFLFASSCKEEGERQKKVVSAQDLVFGGSSCEDHSQCVSGLCKFGMCAGYLIVSRFVERLEVAKRIRQFIEQGRVKKSALEELATRMFNTPESGDLRIRGRLAELLGVVNTPVACNILKKCIEKEKDPLRFHCAVGLALCKDPVAGHVLKGYLNAEEPVRSLAKYFMRRSK